MLRQTRNICVRHLARMDGGKTIKTFIFGKLEGRRDQDQNSGGFTVQLAAEDTGERIWKTAEEAKTHFKFSSQEDSIPTSLHVYMSSPHPRVDSHLDD